MAKSAPISNAEFLSKAEAIVVEIGGKKVKINPRSFSSGSVGFGFSGKVTALVGGVEVPLQASINLTEIGSKPGAKADAA